MSATTRSTILARAGRLGLGRTGPFLPSQRGGRSRLVNSGRSRHGSVSRSVLVGPRYFSAHPQHQEQTVDDPLKTSSSLDEEQNDSLEQNGTESLLHPHEFFKNDTSGVLRMPLPTSISPSAILEFNKCPQSYLFQYIFKVRQPTNPVLVKGLMVHATLDRLFDLDPPSRTLINLQNLFRREWSQNREKEEYKNLFDNASDTNEQQWGQEALELLQNYYAFEDPTTINTPAHREKWVSAKLAIDPHQGATAPGASGYAGADGANGATSEGATANNATFLVRGIIDRLDLVKVPTPGHMNEITLRVCDYKTGKAPHLKYSRAKNEEIVQDSFYQLLIYALLMREGQQKKKPAPKSAALTTTMDLRFLRLFHLTNAEGVAQCLDCDLGATQEVRDAKLFAVHQDLANTWLRICDLVAANDPLIWKGCDRPFCWCHKCRGKFVPGTVWAPSAS